jgi:peptidoglycan/LPS O-acetylase OafA/YrhL
MKQIWGKTKAILIPTIVMFLVFMMYSKQNPLSIIFNYDKSGYWFTWVLFQIFLIFIPFDGISRRFSNKYLKVAVIVSPFVILSILFYFLGYNYKIANLFEWVKVVGYYFFFMTGIIVKLFRNDIHNAFNNKYLLSILLIVALLTYNFIDNLGGKILVINILLIYVCFYKLETSFTQPNNIVSKILRTIGKNTLEIYLIHFFLLFNIPFMPEYLSSLQNDKCFGTNSCSSLPEFLIVGSISLLLCYICIAIKKVLNLFPLITELCFGPIKNNSK